jgi:Skp family chaperone for outer membrane proteins
VAFLRILAIFWVFMASALAVWAQETPTKPVTPVLIINQERLFSESVLGKLVVAVDEAEKQALADLGDKLSSELEAEEQDLTEKRKTMEPAEFRKLAEAFDAKVVGIRTDQDAKAEGLIASIESRRRQFYTQIASVLLETMQSYEAAVILDQRSALISVRGVNVTDEVIAKIDATFKTLADIGINQ